jgi:hypothetical protein
MKLLAGKLPKSKSLWKIIHNSTIALQGKPIDTWLYDSAPGDVDGLFLFLDSTVSLHVVRASPVKDGPLFSFLSSRMILRESMKCTKISPMKCK